MKKIKTNTYKDTRTAFTTKKREKIEYLYGKEIKLPII